MHRTISRRPAASGIVLGIMLTSAAAQADIRNPAFTVDIAGDCNRFIAEGRGHLDPELNPVFGDTFVQEGIIYQGGTFAVMCPEQMDCGLTDTGEPEFPERVIGKWTCYGAFIGNGLVTTEGSWIVSTQVYDFAAEPVDNDVFTPGKHGLISHGTERVDFEPFERAVTGGFGKYRNATGQVEQVKVGFNQTTCENFTFSFKTMPAVAP